MFLKGNNVPDWQEDHDCDGVPDILGESDSRAAAGSLLCVESVDTPG